MYLLSNKDKEDSEYSEERKTLIKNLLRLHFQNIEIRFTSTNILPVDKKMKKARKYDLKIKTYEKWNFSESIALRYLLSAYNRLPIWNMVNKMVTNKNENKKIDQFQVGYMLNPELKINKALK